MSNQERWNVWDLLLASVTPETAKVYMSRLNDMDYLGLPKNYEGLLDRISMNDGTCISTLKGHIAAVQWFMRADKASDHVGLTADQRETLRILLRGRANLMDNAGCTIPRGPLDLPKLHELQDWARSQGCSDSLAWLMELVWACGLRTSQVPLLRRRHFVMVDGHWMLRIEKHHDPHALSRLKPLWDPDRPIHPTAYPFINAIIHPMTNPEEPIDSMKRWNEKLINAWIQEVSVHHGWEPRLDWDGVHCFRHGLAVQVSAEDGNTRRAQLMLGHSSEDTTSLCYALTVEERLEKIAPPRFRITTPGGLPEATGSPRRTCRRPKKGTTITETLSKTQAARGRAMARAVVGRKIAGRKTSARPL